MLAADLETPALVIDLDIMERVEQIWRVEGRGKLH
jgi:hypothetical protein